MSEFIANRRAIAESLLGHALDSEGFGPCPGIALHQHKSGRRDFQVLFDGVPSARCFHTSCGEAVDTFNHLLRSRIAKAESQAGPRRPPVMGSVPPMPVAPRKPKRPPFDPGKLKTFAAGCPVDVTADWLAARSPVPIPEVQDISTAELFLSSLYAPGERVLLFTKEFSQGDFMWETGKGCVRLADRPGIKSVRSPLPCGGPCGAWFLAQPVTGEWAVNPNNRDEHGAPRMGRRHGAVVTAWRYMLLESDEAEESLWLRALVQFPLPIVAAYTSGGRSVHALVRVNAGCKEAWDGLRDDVMPILSGLGADPAALTAVRLTRLPGALRHGKTGKDGKYESYPEPRLQRLLWLDPEAAGVAIIDRR